MPFAAESQSDVESTSLPLLSNSTSCGLERVFRHVDFPAPPAILMIPTNRTHWSALLCVLSSAERTRKTANIKQGKLDFHTATKSLGLHFLYVLQLGSSQAVITALCVIVSILTASTWNKGGQNLNLVS